MAVIWANFITELSQFLSSKKSSGAQETGSKIATIYINSLKTSQTPTGNLFSSAPGEEALKTAFGAVFEKLSKSTSPTAEEKSQDPNFKPAPEEDIPSGSSLSEEQEQEFKDYLKSSQQVKFRFYELKEGGSEFVLETDPAKLEEVLKKRGFGVIGQKFREELFNKEKVVYAELQKQYFEESAAEENRKAKQDEKKEKDPYDDLAAAVIAFWITSGPIVFSSLPPIPPATLNTPGTYTILYPGNPSVLADGIRRSFNLGLDSKFKDDPTGILSATAISKALAVVLAKHLLTLKFIYSGATPASPIVAVVPGIF
jgi:hypothetical protein